MESWMINLMIALAASIGTYSILQYRVKRLEGEGEYFSKSIRSTSRNLDLVKERVTILERDTSKHLDLPTAEEKFVSKRELELHLKLIENVTANTDKNIDVIIGKQDDMLEILSSLKRVS